MRRIREEIRVWGTPPHLSLVFCVVTKQTRALEKRARMCESVCVCVCVRVPVCFYSLFVCVFSDINRKEGNISSMNGCNRVCLFYPHKRKHRHTHAYTRKPILKPATLPRPPTVDLHMQPLPVNKSEEAA